MEPSSFVVSVVDDDTSFREALTGLINSFGFRTESFESAEGFLGSEALTKTACLISDVNMPGVGGLALQARLATIGATIPTIFVTAACDQGARQLALSNGAIGLLDKPVDPDELLGLIRTLLAA